jgi:hypothetical protein
MDAWWGLNSLAVLHGVPRRPSRSAAACSSCPWSTLTAQTSSSESSFQWSHTLSLMHTHTLSLNLSLTHILPRWHAGAARLPSCRWSGSSCATRSGWRSARPAATTSPRSRKIRARIRPRSRPRWEAAESCRPPRASPLAAGPLHQGGWEIRRGQSSRPLFHSLILFFSFPSLPSRSLMLTHLAPSSPSSSPVLQFLRWSANQPLLTHAASARRSTVGQCSFLPTAIPPGPPLTLRTTTSGGAGLAGGSDGSSGGGGGTWGGVVSDEAVGIDMEGLPPLPRSDSGEFHFPKDAESREGSGTRGVEAEVGDGEAGPWDRAQEAGLIARRSMDERPPGYALPSGTAASCSTSPVSFPRRPHQPPQHGPSPFASAAATFSSSAHPHMAHPLHQVCTQAPLN